MQLYFEEITLKLLSTLNLGFSTAVKNFWPSGDQAQQCEELDLHEPTFSNFVVSHISISPDKLPKPYQRMNR